MTLRPITRFLKHNGILKLFSVVLAALLWLTIASEDNYISERTVPINFRGIPNNMETVAESATEVHLRLRGSRNVLDNLAPSDVTAVISLAGEAPGAKNIPFNESNVQTPGGVEVIRYDPPRIQFGLERTTERTLPVRPVIEGQEAAGFVRGEVTVTPDTVLVQGPESEVRGLEFMPTATVNVDGSMSSVDETVPLNVADPLIRLPAPAVYEVRVEIREADAEHVFLATQDPRLEESRWRVEPAEINVHVTGPRNLVDAFDAEGLTFTVDTTELDPETTHLVEPRVPALADGDFVTAFDPPVVEIRFTEP